MSLLRLLTFVLFVSWPLKVFPESVFVEQIGIAIESVSFSFLQFTMEVENKNVTFLGRAS